MNNRKGKGLTTTYQGTRNENNETTVTYQLQGKSPKPLRHVNYHSPDGFEWGYGGSGPADLALSILAHHLGETWVNGPYLRNLKITATAPLCWKFHQDFKRDVIARFDRGSWELTSKEVGAWLLKQEPNSLDLQILWDEFVEFGQMELTENNFATWMKNQHPESGWTDGEIGHFLDEMTMKDEA